jgi:hypothetical protein
MRCVKCIVVSLLVASPAFAQEPEDEPTPSLPAASTSTPSATPTSSPSANAPSTGRPASARGQGVAVLAIGNATEATWGVAQKIYASPVLRPSGVDEAHARVLAGEAPATDAPKDLRDLADTRAAIRGDDAPSRQLLASIAATFAVRGVVVVDTTASGPRARLFLVDSSEFDAASWTPVADEAGSLSWEAAVRSLERTLQPKITPAAPLELPPKTKAKTEESHPFYASPWFWGAIGGAAFLGGAIYFATRDTSPGSIHLQMQVPR